MSVHVNNLKNSLHFELCWYYGKRRECFSLCPTVCSWLDKKICNTNEVCAIWCKSLILIMLYVVLFAVLHFEGYIRYFSVWVCGFVNCVNYFDQTSLVSKILFLHLEKTVKKKKKSAHLWSFSAYFLTEVVTINNCLARWHIQWPVSSRSVILNGSVLKWQT